MQFVIIELHLLHKNTLLPALILNFFDLYVEVHKMPPTLNPFKYRSFGHLILTSMHGNPWIGKC
jgi:hypothetical protein